MCEVVGFVRFLLNSSKKEAYCAVNNSLFLDQKKRIVSGMKKQIAKLGLNPNELGFSSENRNQIISEITTDNQKFNLR